ncbi:MAG: glutamate-5-semialdehyde dehydrogenase [Mucinivorans sp.]
MLYDAIFKEVQCSSRTLPLLKEETINKVLLEIADQTVVRSGYILEQNARDLKLMNLENPKYDRLQLTQKRIATIADDIRSVAALPCPLHRVLEEITRPNGLKIRKQSVAFGVIGMIFEARPNVCFDSFSLCFKSGNAVIFKGGSDAKYSNQAIIDVIHTVLRNNNISQNIAVLLPSGHESTAALLSAVGYVDLVIPRGGSSLINFVRQNARVPVIETGAGICHTYCDKSAQTEMCSRVVFNAKTRRVSVCNALDCLIIHKDKLGDLPQICQELATKNVILYADDSSYAALQGKYPETLLSTATEDSFGTEFLDYKMAIKTVDSLQQAISHITRYSSKHSEAIISEDSLSVERFMTMVDAACLYHNASTAFTDGAQFGLGAEIGISTQKLHSRGPMALRELTTYKYIIEGCGQTRNV